jgi:hypothetical protein
MLSLHQLHLGLLEFTSSLVLHDANVLFATALLQCLRLFLRYLRFAKDLLGNSLLEPGAERR